MQAFYEWFASSFMRNSLTLIVAALIVATCVKWMRLRSPAGEHWVWLLVIAQGVMFVWLTIPSPDEWLPESSQLAPPPKLLPSPQEIDVHSTSPDAKGVPLRLDVPQRDPFDPSRRQFEVILEPDTETELAAVTAPPADFESTGSDRSRTWPLLLAFGGRD